MKKISRVPHGLTLHGPLLDHYYHDFTYELSAQHPVDAAGIPLLDYGYPIGARYHPILIVAYALALHEHFLNVGDPALRQKFLVIADWLVENQIKSQSGFSWDYDVPNFKYFAIPPWNSGMAQGLALSVLLRAHQLALQDSYMDSATRALCSFERAAQQGGCREVDARGNVWYEEVPSTAPSGSFHILNGFIFALWGLYDYVRVTQDRRAQQLLDDGVATLQTNAARFDTGYWTRYSLEPHNYLASRFYHQIHIDGLTIFHTLTGDARFESWARRWTAYTTNPGCLARWWLTFKIFRVVHKLARVHTYWRLL